MSLALAPRAAAPAAPDVPVLETARLRLRPPRAEDWAPCAAFLQSDRAGFVGGPMTEGLAWRAFATILGHWLIRGYGAFVLEEKATGRAVGKAGPWYPAGWPEPELGWALWLAEAEGRGLAAEAVARSRAFAYRELGWRTAVSYVDPLNARSAALASRLGCRVDPAAATPGDDGCRVFRHPGPEGAT
jgi:RimJ/RimL family protein N-acetyltransferase